MGVGDVNAEAARGYGRTARDEAGGGTEVALATDEVAIVAGFAGVHCSVAAAALIGWAIGRRDQTLGVVSLAPSDRLAVGGAIRGTENPGRAIRRALVAGLAEIAHTVPAAAEVRLIIRIDRAVRILGAGRAGRVPGRVEALAHERGGRRRAGGRGRHGRAGRRGRRGRRRRDRLAGAAAVAGRGGRTPGA